MKTKIIKHVELTQDWIINGHKIEHGRVIKNEGWITSSCGKIISNFPKVESEKLWEEVLKIVEQGGGNYIYSHRDYLEDGEKPVSCNGCPHQSFQSGYFDKSSTHEWRMSCGGRPVSEWNDKKVRENAIRKHFDAKTSHLTAHFTKNNIK